VHVRIDEKQKVWQADSEALRCATSQFHSIRRYTTSDAGEMEKKEKNILQQNCKEQASYTRKKQTAQEDNFLPGLHVAEISLI